MPSLHGNWYEARSTAMTSETSFSAMGRMRMSGTASSSSGAVAIETCVALLGWVEPLKYASCELQVLPRLALVARSAQKVGGMIRHNQWSIKLTEVVDLPTQTTQR